MRVWLFLGVLVASCNTGGHETASPPPQTREPTAAEVADASGLDASSWTLPPRPAAPPGIDWPRLSYSELVAKHPALGEISGMKMGDLTIRAEKFSLDRSRLLIEIPGLGLGVLEDVWGRYHGRTLHGSAVWFVPETGIRAHYPGRSSLWRDTLELSDYKPLLDRLEAAPDGFIGGAGPLLGMKVDDVLERYKPWLVHADPPSSKEDRIVQLAAAADEWGVRDVPMAMIVGKRSKRLWSVSLTIGIGVPPVDEDAVLERLHRRWGPSKPGRRQEREWQLPDGMQIIGYRSTDEAFHIRFTKRSLR